MKDTDLENKFVTIKDVALPADDGVLTVKAAVKSDVAGNVVTSPVEKTDTVTIDTTASITMTIKDGVATDTDNSDGYINNADAKIKTIAGTVSDVEEGQTVTVTLTGQGGATKDVTAIVKADGSWETTAIDFSGLSEGTITAVAKVVDKAGNSAESTSDSTIKDTVIPVPTIKLTTDTAGASDTDNISSKGELTIVVDSTADQTTKSTIESVKYVKDDGTEGEITGGNPTDGTGYILPEGKYASITVTSTDAAGNKKTATLNDVDIDQTNPLFATDATEDNMVSIEAGDTFATDKDNRFGYFEARQAGTVIGTVKATDEQVNDTGVYTYKWASSNDATQASWYAIDPTTGEVTLTDAGANSAMNNFEDTSLNEVTLTLEVTDVAGNTSTRDITFELGNVIGIARLMDNMSTTQAVNQYGNGVDASSPDALKTTDNADRIFIGKHEDGTPYSGVIGTGNLFDFDDGGNGRGLGLTGGEYSILMTGGGNDFVRFSSIYITSSIFTGTGDDVLLFDGTSSTNGNGGDAPLIHMEQGDDIFKATLDANGSNILMGSGSDTVKVVRNVINNATIDLGSNSPTTANGSKINYYENRYIKNSIGNDFSGDSVTDVNNVTIGGYVTDGSLIRGSLGQDNVTVGSNLDDGAKVYLGEGDDSLSVGGYILDAKVDLDEGKNTINVTGDVNNSTVTTGSGDDSLTIGYDLRSNAKINLGDGINTMKVGHDINYSTVTTGSGDDTLTVGNNINSGTKINLGDGNNTINAGYVENDSSITTGTGNDTLTLKAINNSVVVNTGAGNDNVTIADSVNENNKETFGGGLGSATLNLGDGDDTFTYGGTTLDGKVNGGAGTDTIVLNTSANVKTNSNTTNLTSSNFTGIEVIKMEGVNGNAVDIQYSDLLKDISNESPLYIQGSDNDVVDLGWNNYNSDVASKANLKDGSGSWSKTSSTDVEGISYDVYHYSKAGADTSNDVYIQQGILVI